MPFNVNDTTVDQLLDQVMKKAGITTKVGAIRAALKSFDTLLNEKTPVRDKFTEIRSKRQSLLGDPYNISTRRNSWMKCGRITK